MKKVSLFIFLFSISVFSQSKFAVEAGGGIDLVMESGSYNNYDNGYSIIISPIIQNE